MACGDDNCMCKCSKRKTHKEWQAEQDQQTEKNREDFANLQSLLLDAVKIKDLTGNFPELGGVLMSEISRIADRVMGEGALDIEKTVSMMHALQQREK